jgi:hypothetical protein
VQFAALRAASALSSFFVEGCFVPPLRGGGGFFLNFTFAASPAAGPSFRASEKKQKIA